MKITPLKGIIQIETEEVKAGALDTSSRNTAVEYAKVVAIGKDVTEVKVGDYIFVKAWGCDLVTHQQKKYIFVNIDNKAILAIIKA